MQVVGKTPAREPNRQQNGVPGWMGEGGWSTHGHQETCAKETAKVNGCGQGKKTGSAWPACQNPYVGIAFLEHWNLALKLQLPDRIDSKFYLVTHQCASPSNRV